MKQRDPNWLKRIVDDATRKVESNPFWMRSAEVETELRRMAERRQAQEAAAARGERSE